MAHLVLKKGNSMRTVTQEYYDAIPKDKRTWKPVTLDELKDKLEMKETPSKRERKIQKKQEINKPEDEIIN